MRQIVNSRFLERPQKRSGGNQLIHRRLTRTKSIGSGQDSESQAGRLSDGNVGWCLELRRGGKEGEEDALSSGLTPIWEKTGAAPIASTLILILLILLM